MARLAIGTSPSSRGLPTCPAQAEQAVHKSLDPVHRLRLKLSLVSAPKADFNYISTGG
jgi:hypothetical protein